MACRHRSEPRRSARFAQGKPSGRPEDIPAPVAGQPPPAPVPAVPPVAVAAGRGGGAGEALGLVYADGEALERSLPAP